MTNGQLIKRLQKYPKDWTILTGPDNMGNWFQFSLVRKIKCPKDFRPRGVIHLSNMSLKEWDKLHGLKSFPKES